MYACKSINLPYKNKYLQISWLKYLYILELLQFYIKLNLFVGTCG
jgi:hypothetical protein